MAEGLPESPVRVAILPPSNLSADEDAPRVVHDALTNELLQIPGVEVVDPGLVRDAMRRARVFAPDLLDRQQRESLKGLLGVSYLLVGSIHEYGTVGPTDDPLPVVSIHLRFIHAATGRVLWSASLAREGDDGETVFGIGRVRSMDRLVRQVVHAMAASLRRFLETAPVEPPRDEWEVGS
jgi:hypothetical protein